MIYTLMAVVFVMGYIAIALEHNIHVDKAASGLMTAVLLWTLLVIGGDTLLAGNPSHVANSGMEFLNSELRHHLAEIAEILFFLMGAMVIVELIDAHDGFAAITRRIKTTNAVTLLWIISGLTFFLSAMLDNLTTTIVMVSLLRKIITDQKLRWWFVGMVVVCANAGGAWSPIGDVTTTMLWIGNQITANHIIVSLFIPSLIAALVPVSILSIMFKGKSTISNTVDSENSSQEINNHHATDDLPISSNMRLAVLLLGLGALAFVPIFKTLTHLPPYMGILFGVAVLWIFTEINYRHQHWDIKQRVTVVGVLTRVDMPSILFFLGILLAVSGLATAGHLTDMGKWLDNNLGNLYVINILIGLMSSLVDNVPLVAGAMKMYPLVDSASLSHLSGAELTRQSQFIQNGQFWNFLAYCAGTGGSCLIIGSAAGVAAMGMEKIPFTWYLKRISGLALLGYLSGAMTYILVHVL